MTTHWLENQLAQQTIFEVDLRLSYWSQTLRTDRNLELGDNPRLIQSIEDDLRHSTAKINRLQPVFDLAWTPLSRANYYFALRRQFTSALRKVQAIRARERGSRQYTRDCLDEIEACLMELRRVGTLLPASDAKVH